MRRGYIKKSCKLTRRKGAHHHHQHVFYAPRGLSYAPRAGDYGHQELTRATYAKCTWPCSLSIIIIGWINFEQRSCIPSAFLGVPFFSWNALYIKCTCTSQQRELVCVREQEIYIKAAFVLCMCAAARLPRIMIPDSFLFYKKSSGRPAYHPSARVWDSESCKCAQTIRRQHTIKCMRFYLGKWERRAREIH